jgi:hypothetical protein
MTTKLPPSPSTWLEANFGEMNSSWKEAANQVKQKLRLSKERKYWQGLRKPPPPLQVAIQEAKTKFYQKNKSALKKLKTGLFSCPYCEQSITAEESENKSHVCPPAKPHFFFDLFAEQLEEEIVEEEVLAEGFVAQRNCKPGELAFTFSKIADNLEEREMQPETKPLNESNLARLYDQNNNNNYWQRQKRKAPSPLFPRRKKEDQPSLPYEHLCACGAPISTRIYSNISRPEYCKNCSTRFSTPLK